MIAHKDIRTGDLLITLTHDDLTRLKKGIPHNYTFPREAGGQMVWIEVESPTITKEIDDGNHANRRAEGD